TGLVTISPSDPDTDTVVESSVQVSDPDGDEVGTVFSWYVNGVKVAHATTVLDGKKYFVRGDEIMAEVLLYDRFGATNVIVSDVITVQNIPPTPPTLKLPPELADAADLLCEVATPGTDGDLDELTYEMRWTVNGVPFDGASTTRWPGDTASRHIHAIAATAQ